MHVVLPGPFGVDQDRSGGGLGSCSAPPTCWVDAPRMVVHAMCAGGSDVVVLALVQRSHPESAGCMNCRKRPLIQTEYNLPFIYGATDF